jgi:two-component system, LytTR family, response regulator
MSSKIRAVIVDDEAYSCETLATLLERYCTDVVVVDICTSGEAALKSIKKYAPDLLFLDIEMPHMNGFELLKQLDVTSFQLIFTTSYDQYAIKAIRFSALDYLLKPIDREELKAAVQKVVQKMEQPLPQQLSILLQKISGATGAVQKIALPTMEGLQMLPIDTIIHCASDSNYTNLFLKGGKKITVSKTLKDIEEMLEDHSFLRVHHSHLVNTNEIERYIKGEGGYLILSDGTSVDVSRSRKEQLLQKLQASNS